MGQPKAPLGPDSFLVLYSIRNDCCQMIFCCFAGILGIARIFHESSATTADMAVLPGVLGCRTLRRTAQVRLGSNPLWLPGRTAIFTVSQRHFVKYAG